MVKYMQGDIFTLPTTSNTPSEVTFTLPDPPTYTGLDEQSQKQ